MHGIVREKFAVFLRKLGGQSFVVGNDERRLANLSDDIGRRKGLAGASHAKKRLVLHASTHPPHESLNSLRLIPRRRMPFGLKFEDGVVFHQTTIYQKPSK